MRAGLLKETIHIYEEKRVTSSSGFVEKKFVETHKIRAYRKKLSALVGDGINASEEFIGNTLVFQTRKYSFLNDKMRIKYGSNLYKIILFDLQADNTLLITCSKLNG